MACADKSLLIQAYMDGELDLVRSLELEEHLKTCESCAQELRSQQTLRNGLRSSGLYVPVPEGLEARIRQALPGRTIADATQATQVGSLAAAPSVAPRRRITLISSGSGTADRNILPT